MCTINFEEISQRVERIKIRLYRTVYLYFSNEVDALEAVDEAVYQALCALKSRDIQSPLFPRRKRQQLLSQPSNFGRLLFVQE